MTNIRRLLTGDHRDPRDVLAEIFGVSVSAGNPPPEIRAWAMKVLSEAGVDPVTAPTEAIGVLRQTEPRLDLKPAEYLVAHLP